MVNAAKMPSDADLACIPSLNGTPDLNTTSSSCMQDIGSEADIPDYFQMSETADMVMKTLPRIVMILIAITGLTGNSIVLYIIVKHRDMRTVTNYFVANLAITDITFLVLCVIPTVIVIGGIHWPLGGFMCRVNSYFQYVSICNLILPPKPIGPWCIMHSFGNENMRLQWMGYFSFYRN